MSLAVNIKAPSLLAYHRVLSPSASIRVSSICLGAMNFGQAWKGLLGECTKETCFEILDYFHSQGGNFIDTANMYMQGESEIWLGEWMTARKTRDQMVIATKFSNPERTPYTEPEGIILSNYGGNNKKALRLSLDASLKRLNTDYVDIYYVHIWDGLTEMEELMRALDDIVRSGKALYLGVSNWPAWVVVKANAYARQHGLSPFVVYEGRWNPADRAIERDILPMCKSEGMGITVWQALGGGKFRTPEQKAKSDGRTFGDDLGSASVEQYEKFAVKMGEVGKRRGTDAMGVALRYVMLKAPYVFPIIGGRKVEHLKGNIAALSVNLTVEDIKEIESADPFDFGYPHSILSGDRYESISSSKPSWCVSACSLFAGVEELKPIRSEN